MSLPKAFLPLSGMEGSRFHPLTCLLRCCLPGGEREMPVQVLSLCSVVWLLFAHTPGKIWHVCVLRQCCHPMIFTPRAGAVSALQKRDAPRAGLWGEVWLVPVERLRCSLLLAGIFFFFSLFLCTSDNELGSWFRCIPRLHSPCYCNPLLRIQKSPCWTVVHARRCCCRNDSL